MRYICEIAELGGFRVFNTIGAKRTFDGPVIPRGAKTDLARTKAESHGLAMLADRDDLRPASESGSWFRQL